MKTFPPRFEILPQAQRDLWAELGPIKDFGFVLYGGTAVALQLGHRSSVDFDFFNHSTFDRQRLKEALPFFRDGELIQDHHNTLEVITRGGVKVSFFGGITFGRIGTPRLTADGVMAVASLEDIMATKLKVMHERSESKDYRDIAAMIRAGVSLETGLAAADKMYAPDFAPQIALKALVYFEDGDLKKLGTDDRRVLVNAASVVKALPDVMITPSLRAHDARPPGASRSGVVAPSG